jgi:hypothetical protein
MKREQKIPEAVTMQEAGTGMKLKEGTTRSTETGMRP